MDREDFMAIVYSELASDSDNCRANRIIDAADEYADQGTGEWLEREVIDEPNGKIINQWQSARCSVCKLYHTTPYTYTFTHYDYCPNCGKKMVKK